MIELIILGMLYNGQIATTYDIKKAMENSTEFFHSSSLGSIQPALKKMEKDGYFTSEEKIENNRLKKYYRITEAGKALCDLEIRKDFGPDKLRCNQLVKLFFFDKMTIEEQFYSLDTYIKTQVEIKEKLEKIEVDAHNEMDKRCLNSENYPAFQYQMDALQFGLDYHQFVAEWFANYKKTLSQRLEKEETL